MFVHFLSSTSVSYSMSSYRCNIENQYKNLDGSGKIQKFQQLKNHQKLWGSSIPLLFPLIFLIFPLIFIFIFSFYFKLIETFFPPHYFICFPLRIQFSLSKIPPTTENTLLLRTYEFISFKGHLDNKDVHFQKSPSDPPASPVDV